MALATLVHAAHAGISLARARASFTRSMMALALGGLALTALFGTVLGVDKVWHILPGALFPTLHAHVHLALLGWVLPTVLAVAARVYPMFLLAPETGVASARVQLAGVAAGGPLVVIGLLLETPAAVVVGALLAATAVTAHVAWIGTMVRARKRPRLDWGLAFALAGAVFLAAATALGMALATGLVAGPRAALAYGVLALGGWASLTIVGMLLKIVPFLVWYRVYGPRAGRAPVPTLAQLSWRTGEAAAFARLVPGVAARAVTVALGDVIGLRIAGVALALGAIAFASVLAGVLRHLVRTLRQPVVVTPVMRAAS